MTRIASCQCRGFRIIVEAEQPDTVAICHCQICQRPRLSGETQTAQLLLPDLSICVQISLVLLLGASTTEISPSCRVNLGGGDVRMVGAARGHSAFSARSTGSECKLKRS